MKHVILKNIEISVLTLVLASSAFAYEPLPSQPPVPTNNPMSAAKVELGKKLFFDARLSLDGTVSCNSCHSLMAGGVDNLATSTGINAQKGGRNAPTVWNAAFLSTQFWDGRAKSLEEQAVGPISNPIEMGMPNHAAAVERIKTIPGYVQEFKSVFGGKSSITIDNIGKAIATYERTLITPNSPFDRYLGGDKKAISKNARKGSELFQNIGCIACHSGAAFAGPALPDGTGFFQRFPTFGDNQFVKKYKLDADLGRFDVTKSAGDKNLFRVPTLRNIGETAPYFHNGAVPTLEQAVRVMAKTQLNKDLTDKETAQLVDF